MIKIVAFALATSLVSLASQAATVPLVNGSFETNNVGAGEYRYSSDIPANLLPSYAANVTATGWSFQNGAGVSSDNSAFSGVASSGTYFAFLQNVSSISQTFTAAANAVETLS